MTEAPTKQKLWGGRFTGKTDPLYVFSEVHVSTSEYSSSMHAFNQSLHYDKRMYAADVRGSIAYAKSLTLVGILNRDEEGKIVSGLQAVEKEWRDGNVGFIICKLKYSSLGISSFFQFQIKEDDEDIHTANERRLSELIGPLAGKLHTGRSRNDQVATDMRIWLLDECKSLENDLKALIRVLVGRADSERDYLMPGYTHLQVCLSGVVSLISDRIILKIRSREGNQFDGRTCYCRMHCLSKMTWIVFVRSFLVFQSFHLAVVPWLAIRLVSTVNS